MSDRDLMRIPTPVLDRIRCFSRESFTRLRVQLHTLVTADAQQRLVWASGETMAEEGQQQDHIHFMRNVQTAAEKKHLPDHRDPSDSQMAFVPLSTTEVRSVWVLLSCASDRIAGMLVVGRDDVLTISPSLAAYQNENRPTDPI